MAILLQILLNGTRLMSWTILLLWCNKTVDSCMINCSDFWVSSDKILELDSSSGVWSYTLTCHNACRANDNKTGNVLKYTLCMDCSEKSALVVQIMSLKVPTSHYRSTGKLCCLLPSSSGSSSGRNVGQCQVWFMLFTAVVDGSMSVCGACWVVFSCVRYFYIFYVCQWHRVHLNHSLLTWIRRTSSCLHTSVSFPALPIANA